MLSFCQAITLLLVRRIYIPMFLRSLDRYSKFLILSRILYLSFFIFWTRQRNQYCDLPNAINLIGGDDYMHVRKAFLMLSTVLLWNV